jgi:hypothetical protein
MRAKVREAHSDPIDGFISCHVGNVHSASFYVNKAMAPTAPRIKATELANCATPPVGADVSTAVPEPVAEREAARVLLVTAVEPRVCELNVELRDMGTPVLIEAPVTMEVIDDEFIDVDKVVVPE